MADIARGALAGATGGASSLFDKKASTGDKFNSLATGGIAGTVGSVLGKRAGAGTASLMTGGVSDIFRKDMSTGDKINSLATGGIGSATSSVLGKPVGGATTSLMTGGAGDLFNSRMSTKDKAASILTGGAYGAVKSLFGGGAYKPQYTKTNETFRDVAHDYKDYTPMAATAAATPAGDTTSGSTLMAARTPITVTTGMKTPASQFGL